MPAELEVAQLPSDPLALLNDESLYGCERAIPVFKPHRRMFRDVQGELREKYEVTADDLRIIAENANAALTRDGHLSRHTIGHVQFDGTPEGRQPAVLVGATANFRPGVMRTPDGDQNVLLADLYTRRDMVGEAKKFPFRSAEYNWQKKTITGVARLLRDPALGLGTTGFYSDSAETVCYADAVGEVSATPGDAVWAYLASTINPKAQENKPMPIEPTIVAPGVTPEQYAAQEARVNALADQNAALLKRLDTLSIDKIADGLVSEKYQFDRDDFTFDMLARNPDQRAKYVTNLKANAKQRPDGVPPVPVLEGLPGIDKNSDEGLSLTAADFVQVSSKVNAKIASGTTETYQAIWESCQNEFLAAKKAAKK